MIELPNAPTFSKVTRQSVLEADDALGLLRRTCERELERISTVLPKALAEVHAEIEAQNQDYPASVKPFLVGEMRMLRAIESVVVPFMLQRVKR